MPFVDMLRVVTASGYLRFPVYQETIDQIVGMLSIKQLLRVWGQPAIAELRSLLYAPSYVLESQRAVVAFQQLNQEQSALAIVLDEYGQVAGLITIADIIEEVVGPIDDQHVQREQAIVRRDNGSYLVDGLLPFVDLQQQLDLAALALEAHPHDFETVAGFVLVLFGHIPLVSESVEWLGYRLEVVDMDGRRIDKVLIRPLHE
ncbi:MAG: transporter associated domain-containing protein [Roseiflexaceae bacterium]